MWYLLRRVFLRDGVIEMLIGFLSNFQWKQAIFPVVVLEGGVLFEPILVPLGCGCEFDELAIIRYL